jgi:hypothetical protein
MAVTTVRMAGLMTALRDEAKVAEMAGPADALMVVATTSAATDETGGAVLARNDRTGR